MKTTLYVLIAASLVFNGLCVKSCMDAEKQIAEINKQLQDAEVNHTQAIASYQKQINEKLVDIDNLSAEGELLRHERDNLKVKYDNANGVAAYWKKKFGDSNSVEDCTRFAESLEFSLAICDQENAANEGGWTLCEQRYTALTEVVVLKDGTIAEHVAFQIEQQKAIDKLQALLKAPRKISLLNVILPAAAFLLGVAVGG